MTATNILRLINVLLAILSVPPAIGVLFHVWRERTIVRKAPTYLNVLLRYLFGMFALGGLFNAFLSLGLFLGLNIHGWGEPAQWLFNARNIVTNLTLFVTSWGFFTIVNKGR